MNSIIKKLFSSSSRVFITGGRGQLARNLIPILKQSHGASNILVTDLQSSQKVGSQFKGVDYAQLDATNGQRFTSLAKDFKPTHIVNMASILSAKGEIDPKRTWSVNNTILFNSIDICLNQNIQLFSPSSAAVYGGPYLNRQCTPNDAEKTPQTMYGCTKTAIQLVGNYYYRKHGLDFRSLRYPAVISCQNFAAGGSLSYPQEMYYMIVGQNNNQYEIYLRQDTYGPIIYIDDAVRATYELMFADPTKMTVRCYNLAGHSACPADFVKQLKRQIQSDNERDFSSIKITFKPEERRQKIIDGWTNNLDDSMAAKQWGWKTQVSFGQICDKLYKKALEGFD